MTVFTITYNEELMLPYFIAHYRSAFPECRIVVYDNMSNDRTVEIALKNDCEVRPYDTDGKLDDKTYLEIKNNYWKGINDWVIIADCDELIDFKAIDLLIESKKGATIIDFEGYNMVNMSDNLDILGIKTGVRAESYDKKYCFDATKITDINYSMGCHHANPKGIVVNSKKKYKARHYKYINIEYMIKRHRVFASRLSDENIKKGYGGHYLYTSEEITNEFLNARKQAKIIL